MNMAGIDESFQSDVEQAIEYLKSVGCSEIYLFGSLGSGESRADSDIDIAVRGIEPEQFFYIYGELMSRLKHRVDLVDLDLQKNFGRILVDSGSLRRVA
jgi:predicted nucleotidyltransferase